MAVTILQQPTSPNAANSNLLFSVSSSNALQPQFSYVCDIYESGSSERLARITQVPNPSGNATFKVSDVVKANLQYKDYKKQPVGVGTTSLLVGTTYSDQNAVDTISSKVFTFEFGEAYGTSTSSSLTYYPDLTSTDLTLFPAVWSANDPTDPQVTVPYRNNVANPYTLNYNFPSSSFLYSPVGNNFGDQALTDDPYKLTVAKKVIAPENPGAFVFKTVGQDHYETFSYLSQVAFATLPNQIGITTFFADVNLGTISLRPSSYSQFDKGYIVNFGVGPANITDFANSGEAGSELIPVQAIASGSWTHYQINIGGDFSRILNESYAYNSFNGSKFGSPDPRYEIVQGTEKLRFAFINRYGVYDYFTVYGSLKRNSQITRDTVNKPKVDYSSLTSIYSVSSRGEDQYHFSETDNYSITTQLLNKQMANWVEQLFDSPEVYVQQGSEFVPVVINNQQYQHNNSTARNKTFTYTIEFSPSKGREIYSEPTQDCLTIPDRSTLTFAVTSSNLPLTTASLSVTGSEQDIIYWNTQQMQVTFPDTSGSGVDSISFYYEPDSNVQFSSSYQYLNGPTTASVDYSVYVDNVLTASYNNTVYLNNSGSYEFNFSKSFLQPTITKLTVSASYFDLGDVTPIEFRTSQYNLVCVNSKFLDINTEQEVVRRIEYGLVPQLQYDTQNFYYRSDETFGIGTQLRNSDATFITASGFLVGTDVEVRPANTLNRIKDKMWSIHTGSLYTITSGVVTDITDLGTYTDTQAPLVSLTGLPSSGNYLKVSQDYDDFAAYDISLKSSYNFNAYASFTATGYLVGGNSGNFSVLNGGPIPDFVFYGKRRYWWRGLPQNAPNATNQRLTRNMTSNVQCGVNPPFGNEYRTVTYPGWETSTSNASMLHWVWRGYQYIANPFSPETPGGYGDVSTVTSYTGSFTNTLFVSGALEPNKRIWNGPNTVATSGTGPVGGFTSRGTGSNDYFPILTQDGIKAVLYDADADIILQIKNSDNTDYTGSVVKRWEGPYFWRGPLYSSQAQARDVISTGDITASIYMDPFKSIEDINVGDTVYTSFNINDGSANTPLNGQNYYTKLFDYHPSAQNPPGLGSSITYVYQINSSGEIIDRTLASTIVTKYEKFVKCTDGSIARSTTPDYNSSIPEGSIVFNGDGRWDEHWTRSGSIDSSAPIISVTLSTASVCPSPPPLYQLMERCFDSKIVRSTFPTESVNYVANQSLYNTQDCSYYTATSNYTQTGSFDSSSAWIEISGSTGCLVETGSFDFSMCGQLTVNHWIDLTDTGSMNLSGSAILEVYDKGTAAQLLTMSVDTGDASPVFINSQTGSHFNNTGAARQKLISNNVPVSVIGTTDKTFLTIWEAVDIYNSIDPVVHAASSLYSPDYLTAAENRTVQTTTPSAYTMPGTTTADGNDYIGTSMGNRFFGSNDTFDYSFKYFTSGSEAFLASGINQQSSGNNSTLQASAGGTSMYANFSMGDSGVRGDFNGIAIGGYFNSTTTSNNYIKHVLVYEGLLTSAQVQELFARWKYYRDNS